MTTEDRLRAQSGCIATGPGETRRQAADGREPSEPIAILGIGCRFPGGVDSPDDLWRLLSEEGDAISQFPTDRGWNIDALFGPDPDAPGATYVRAGGFVQSVADFDAAFFGISPREAQAMDPQQRLLLEATWEALERAGINPSSLHGSDSGVFIGACVQEYGPRIYEETEGFAGYLTTGTPISVASGRVSYTLGLQGPAVSVDTACSSSLVAVHLAVRSLRSGECHLAIAGGATVMCSPSVYIGFGRQGALSKDGRSKPFAAAADGFGVSEGAGVLVLARLSHARSLGYPVLALIRGSALGQDGASNVLSAPSGPAQQRVIRQALLDADLTTGDVDVVEAHGTGTRIGDPIEAEALAATYGKAHSAARPLLVGSVKSNIGHTQWAAGLAGVIKIVQSIRNGIVPATLHLDSPTPQVDWSSGTIEVVDGARPWPDQTDHPRRAGVSAFGISGTNAHVILEQAPEEFATVDCAAKRPLVMPWVLSAKSASALAEQAARLQRFVEQRTDADPNDVAYSLVATRASFDHRAVVVGAGRDELLSGLGAIASGAPAPNVVTGKAAATGGTVFVFPGQGSQWTGMAVELLDTAPAFADQMRRCDAAFAEFVDWSLLEAARGGVGSPGLDRVDVVQPVLFAVMVSLAAQWRAMGVQPDAVLGHSQGEIAAAYVAGALSLRDAAKVVCLRSRAVSAIAGTGGMVSIPRPVQQVCALIEPWGDLISIAAQNGPSSTVVTGNAAALDELMAKCERDDVLATRIPVDYAYHSAHVEALRETLRESLSGLQPRTGDIAFISAVTGAGLDTSILDGDYWFANLRQPVLFEDAVRWSYLHSYRTFIECSPHPVLNVGIQESLDDYGDDHSVVGTLRRNEGGMRRFLLSAAEAHVYGKSPNWASTFDGTGAGRIDLPTYAFQRKRYWMDPAPGFVDASSLGVGAAEHPLLGAVVAQADSDEVIFTGRLSLASHPWLADHKVHGVVLVPGAAMVELALHAGDHAGCPRVDELVLYAPLIVGEHGGMAVQVVMGAWRESGERPIRIYSRIDDGVDRRWTRHAEGLLSPVPAPTETAEIEPWPPAGAEPIDVSELYPGLAALGYAYGPAFRGLRSLWRRGAEVFVEAELPEQAKADASRFGLHPALLDAILHGIAAGGILAESELTRLPFEWEGVSLDAVGATRLRARIMLVGDDTVAVTLMDSRGALVGRIDSLALRGVSPSRFLASTTTDDGLYGLDWVTLAPSNGSAGGVDNDTVTVLRCPTTVADSAAVADGTRRTLAQVLDRVQNWLLSDCPDDDARLVVLTRGAIAVDSSEDVTDLAQAAVWGLLRSAQTENPGRILLADVDDWGSADVAVAEAAGRDESQIALRDGVCFAPRLARAERLEGAECVEPTPLDPEGTVLITGGTGVLGTLLARHLVTRHDARNLLLVSRKGRAAGSADAIESELTELGASVRIESCDAADRDSLHALLAGIPVEHPLTAVIHAAGVLDDAVFAAQTPRHLDAVLRPKVDAAWNLHELTASADLSGFVLFSSAAGVLGSAGQANYGAANAFLDALAQHRRQQGLPGVSMAWGWWAQATGMTGHLDERDRARMRRGGFIPMSSADGLALFDAALSHGRSFVVPAQFDLAAIRSHSAVGGLPPIFRGLIRAARRTAESAAAVESSSDLRQRLGAMSTSEQEHELLDIIRSNAAVVLGHDSADAVGTDQEFITELGFDSLGAVELWNRLKSATGLKLPTTAVFDHPTPKALARYLTSALDTGGAATIAQVRERSRTASNNENCVPVRIPADV